MPGTRKHLLIISAVLLSLAVGIFARRSRPVAVPAAGCAFERPPGAVEISKKQAGNTSKPAASAASNIAQGDRATGSASVPTAGVTSSDSHVLSLIAKPGDSVASLARRYLSQTLYMRQSELESAIRQANLLEGNAVKPGREIAIPGILITPVQDKPVPVSRDFEARAIYLTGYTAGSARGLELVKQWKAAGGNSVVFDVKDYDGALHVRFDHKYAPRGNLTISNLPKYIHYLHSLKLHVIARIALFRDQHLAEAYPELAIRSRRTGKPWLENGKLAWTDPSNPEVQQYDLDLARMAAAAGADEIQFDYVRFPAEGDQADCEFMFQQQHPDWPRSKIVTDFVARAEDDLHAKGVLLSIDVFGVMAWARPVDLKHTGQDIAELARHVDVMSPMIYPSHFFGMDGYALPGDAPEHFISESMRRFGNATQGSGVVIRPWLQAFAWRTKSYSTDYILTQVRVAKDEGGVGFLLWNARNEYPRPFEAMPRMRAAGQRYFRGDEIGEPTPVIASGKASPGTPAPDQTSTAVPSATSGQATTDSPGKSAPPP